MLNVLITGAKSGFLLLTGRRFGRAVHAGYRSKDRANDLDAMAPELGKIRPCL